MESALRWINSTIFCHWCNDDLIYSFRRRRAEKERSQLTFPTDVVRRIDSTMQRREILLDCNQALHRTSCSGSGSNACFFLHLTSSVSKLDFSEKSRCMLKYFLILSICLSVNLGTYKGNQFFVLDWKSCLGAVGKSIPSRLTSIGR